MDRDERPTIRVLYASAAVIIGDERCRPSHPFFSLEVPSCVWPCIAFPRVPAALHHEQFGTTIGDPNTAMVYNVGRMYRREALDPRGTHNDWIDVEPSILAEMMAEFDPAAAERGAAPFVWGDAPIPASAYLAQRVNFRKIAGGHFDHLEAEEVALASARAVVAAGYQARATRRRRRLSDAHARFHKEAVAEVRSILSQRLGERHRLSDLSRAVHVSQFHLCRLFRRHTGTSIHRYLDALRLRRAMEMIECGGQTMAQIALSIGYVSESHFSDAFNRELGLRPSEFRARLNGGCASRTWAPHHEPTTLDLGEMCRGRTPVNGASVAAGM